MWSTNLLAIGAAVGVYYDWQDMESAAAQQRAGLMWMLGARAGAGTVGIASSLALLFVERAAFRAVFIIGGWASLGVSLAVSLIIWWLTPSEEEEWLTACPFRQASSTTTPHKDLKKTREKFAYVMAEVGA